MRMVIALSLVSALAAAAGPSMDESRILFLRLDSMYWQLWSMMPDGSGQKQLTDSPVDKVHAAGRPGSSEILYHTNRGESFVLDLSDGTEKRVLTDISIRDAAWSPDGERLAYGVSPEDKVRGKGSLWISNLNGGGRLELTDEIGWRAAPAWLSGGVVLYTRQTQQSNFELKHELWFQELGSREPPRRVQGDDEPSKFDPAVFSREGETIIAYSSLRSGFYEIWVQEASGGESTRLTALEAYSGNPTISQDGSVLAFDSDAGGSVQIYRIGRDGSGLNQLTSGDGPSRKPVWVGGEP